MDFNKKQKPINIKNFTTFLVGTFILLLFFLTGILRAHEVVLKAEDNITEKQVLVVTNRMLAEVSETQFVFNSIPSDIGKHYYLQANLSSDQWVFSNKNSLDELLNTESAYEDWLIFVHGDSKTLLSAVQRAYDIQEIHKVNVLVYAWPSRDEEMGAIKNFKNSYENIESSVSMFSNFLTEIEDVRINHWKHEGEELTLFFHSLGNYYLEKLVEDGYHQQFQNPFFDNLIINAAAVEQEGHSNWVEQIIFSQRIFINSNDEDLSLSGLRVLTKLGRQLGESAGLHLAGNAIYVDFTEIVGFPGMGPSHSYYFAEKTMKIDIVKDYYSIIFHGMEPLLLSNELLVMNIGLAE